jgi:hypothetical protein
MKKMGMIVLIIAFALCTASCTQDEKANKVIKEGVLGAGAGAIGGLASGASAGDIWKGGLAGAGVAIVGGMIFDAMSGEKVGETKKVDKLTSQDAYKEGYSEGFKQGYAKAMKEAGKPANQQ